MKRLIKASNFKLRKNSSVKIASIVNACIVFLGFLLFYAALHILTGSMIEAAGGEVEDLTAFDEINLLDCAAIALSLMQVLAIVLAIIVTLLISGERKNGVYSLMAAKGYTRGQIYGNKLYEVMVVCLLLYISYVASALLIGGILWHGPIETDMITGFLKMVPLIALMYMTIAFIFLAVAMNVKNGGAAMAINLMIVLVLSTAITAIDTAMWDSEVVLRKWWIFSAIEQYAYLEITGKEIITSILNILIYGGISILVGRGIFARTEMK